jgi:hypothetical protein
MKMDFPEANKGLSETDGSDHVNQGTDADRGKRTAESARCSFIQRPGFIGCGWPHVPLEMFSLDL